MAKRTQASANLGPKGIGYRTKVLSQLLYRLLQHKLAPYDLTAFHWLVLNCLWTRNGLAVSEIADKLQQVGGTMTGVIDRMEERQLVYRERDAQDRRVWRIWLTEKGKKLSKTLPGAVTKEKDKLYAGISSEEQQLFSDLLDRLTDNALALLGEFESNKSQ